jgi:hypothetical protein
VGVTLRRVRLTGVTLLLRVGVLLRGFLTTNGPGREIGTTTGGATNRVGHFVADDSLGADKLDPEEPSLPTEGGNGFPGRDFDIVGTSSEFPFLDGFGWLEARFELATGRSSCGGREPAKCTGNDDRIDAADGDVVVVLEVAVPKGAPRAWIGLLGFPEEDWGL